MLEVFLSDSHIMNFERMKEGWAVNDCSTLTASLIYCAYFEFSLCMDAADHPERYNWKLSVAVLKNLF
jgi:hypothetical protein